MNKKGIYDVYSKNGDELLDALIAETKFCFSVREIQARLGLGQNSVVKILTKLRKKNKIIALSKGLYAYFPPSERKFGFSVIKVLHEIMAYWKVPYYVGLLSAADHYGAAHHKPQILQVMIPKQITFRKAKDLGISFHVKKNFPQEGLVQIKMPFGYIFYATQELLALDLIEYEYAGGGIDNVALVIHDLLEQIKVRNLQKMAMHYPVKAAVQRLGFLLEKFNAAKSLTDSLKRVLDHRGCSIVGLSARLPAKGEFDSKWKIIQNITLELEDDI